MIKFRHNYTKLHGQKWAKLLSCEVIRRNDISAETLDYDTEWIDAHGHRHVEDLGVAGEERLLRVVLIGEKMIPFTTYRRVNSENSLKYMDSYHPVFGIVVEE